MTKTLCEGIGQKAITNGYRYPACPVCSKEFSGAGRKWAAKPNPYLVGCPKHYREAVLEDGPQPCAGYPKCVGLHTGPCT